MKLPIALLAIMWTLGGYAQTSENAPAIIWINPSMIQSNTTADKTSVEICIKSKSKLTSVKLYLNNILIESKFIDTVQDVVVKKPNGCNKVIKKILNLTKGNNSLKLIASNEFSSTTQIRTIQYSQVKSAAAEPAPREKRKALVIGNASYVSQAQIPNCQNDADSMEKVLKILDFTVVKRKDLSMSSFLPAIDSFCMDLDQYDVAVVYYSGHGFEVNGFNCMFPIDAQTSSIPELLDHYSITSDPNNSIMKRFYSRGVKKSIFILDACRDNPLYATMSEDRYSKNLKTLRFNETPLKTGDNYRDTVQTNNSSNNSNTTGCLIAYATSSGRTAESVSRNNGKNSPYTAALIINFKRAGLPIIDLLKDVRRTLKKTSMQDQDASFYYSLQDDFIFNKGDTSLYASRKGYLINIIDKANKNYCGVYRNLTVDTAAIQDSIPGLQFHIDFEVTGMRGEGRVSIELYDAEGLPLKDLDTEKMTHWGDGNIRIQSSFATNAYTYSNEDLNRDLFLPYITFDPKLKGKIIYYTIKAIASDYVKLETKLRPIELPFWK